MRQPRITIDPRPELHVGDRIKLADTKRRWTVRSVTRAGRFVILTQPFNPQRTVLYTVIDFDRGVRGKDDRYGLGYETEQDIADTLHQFQHEEDGDDTNECEYQGSWCIGSAEVSHRSANHVRLDIESINDVPTEWTGLPRSERA